LSDEKRKKVEKSERAKEEKGKQVVRGVIGGVGIMKSRGWRQQQKRDSSIREVK
jgi:hypothetical protein